MRSSRSEHLRAIQKLTGARGAPSTDVSPVIVLDDMTAGPWAGAQRWLCGGAVAGGAAVYAELAISNASADPDSRLTIDTLRWKAGAAGSLGMRVVTTAQHNAGGGTPPASSAQLMDPTSSDGLGQYCPGVAWGLNTNSVAWAGFEVAPGDANVQTLQLGLSLPPGLVAAFRFLVANVSLDIAAFGRFYGQA